MKHKIVLLGATGKVGEAVCKVLKSRTESEILIISNRSEHSFLPNVSIANVNLTDKKSLRQTIREFTPSIIINAAAYTNVDACEDNKHEAMSINAELPETLAKISRSLDSKLIHFSTDYIFDGKNGPYTEDELPNPLSFYGKSKLAGENLIRANHTNFLIIRTNIVYGNSSYGKSDFIRWIIDNLRQNRKLNIITGQSGNPTYSQDIAEAVLRFIQKNSMGIFNVAGSFLADRYNIALETARAIGLDSSLISPVPSSSLVQKAQRPESGGLTNIKTLREIDFAPSDLQTGIKNMLDCE